MKKVLLGTRNATGKKYVNEILKVTLLYLIDTQKIYMICPLIYLTGYMILRRKLHLLLILTNKIKELNFKPRNCWMKFNSLYFYYIKSIDIIDSFLYPMAKLYVLSKAKPKDLEHKLLS